MKMKDIFLYLIITGLLAVLFVPFIISTSTLFPFITGKGFTFRILVELLFGIWLAAIAWDSSIRPRFSWVWAAVAGFTAIIIIADLAGVSFYKSFWSNYERMDGLITLIHLYAYFLVAGSVLNTRQRWSVFLNVSVFASVIMSFYAFLQLAGKITINQGGVRVDGTFGNATYLAVYMLFNFFIAIFLLMRSNKDQKTNWLLSSWYIVAMIFHLSVLYSTATRGAILGLIGGLIISAVTIAIFEKGRPGVRKTAIGALVVVIIVVAGFFAIRNTNFVKNSPTLSRFASISVEEVQKQGRRYVWPMAIQGFKEKPILGWGQENFNYVFNKNYDPRMYNQEPWFDRAHNIILDWLVAGGLLGLLGYLSIFVSLLLLIWRSQTFSVTDKAILSGLASAYLFQNLFVFDNLISYVYFFSLLALVHSENVRGKMEPGFFGRIFAQNWTRMAMMTASVVVAVGLIYGLNIRPLQASRRLITAIDPQQSKTAEQSVENFNKVFSLNTFGNGEATEQMFLNLNRFQGNETTQQGKEDYAKLAIEKMDAQIAKFPDDARYLLFMGSMLNRLGLHDKALPYLEIAKRHSPNKQSIYFEIGFAYLSTGDFKTAFETFKKAYDLAPDYSEARLLYGISALYNKNPSLAKELFASLSEEAYLTDERILSAFHGTGNTADAIKILERRVALDPKNPELRFRVAAGYLAINQRAKAVEVLKEVAKLFPETESQAQFYIKEIQAGRNP